MSLYQLRPSFDNMAELSLTSEELEKMLDADFIERARGLGPMSWERYAISLKYAADIILERYKPAIKEYAKMGRGMDLPEEEWFERDVRLIHTYYLLMGLSIENLVKGIIMIRHQEYLKNDNELLKERIGTHNTNWLLKSNNIYGFTDCEYILECLSKCVLWMSKYPVSLKRENFDWGCDWVDPEAVDRLYINLHERLDEEKKKVFK